MVLCLRVIVYSILSPASSGVGALEIALVKSRIGSTNVMLADVGSLTVRVDPLPDKY